MIPLQNLFKECLKPWSAEVGDDVFCRRPFNSYKLEQKAADIFGMEAGLYCPSGTMTNQTAIKVLTQPQQEVICDVRALYL